MTTQEIASKRLAENLKKIVRVALANYNKQSGFYRYCTTPQVHVERFIQHFYLGFYQEVKAEQSRQIVAVPNVSFSFHVDASFAMLES